MKTCPFCAEDIQDAAIVCRFCNRELSAGASVVAPTIAAPVKRQWSVLKIGFAIVGVLWLIGLLSSLSKPSPARPPQSSASPSTPAAAPRPTPAPQGALALLSLTDEISAGDAYHIVEGQVENISGESMRNVQAVAPFYTKDGTFITADNALIEFNPILPGQVSPFKIMARRNPAMSNYSVTFKHMFGGSISTDDRRKKK